MSDWNVGDRPDDGAFIHSELDDYGLTPIEFRVYCRILRRAGTRSAYFEGNASAARSMRMNEKSLKKAIVALEGYQMIRVERRPGQTHIITPTHRSSWNPPSPDPNDLGQNRPHPDPKETDPSASFGLGQNRPHPDPKEADPSASFGLGQNRPRPKETVVPRAILEGGDPKSPDEVNPLSKSKLNKSLSLSLLSTREGENSDPDPEEREDLKISSSPDLEDREGSYPTEPEKNSRTIPDDRNPASPNLDNDSPLTEGDQFSAAPAAPQKKLPPWRRSWADGDYEPGFLDYYARIMSEYYQADKHRSDAIAVIASREREGGGAVLEAKWAEYRAVQEGNTSIDFEFAAQQDAARMQAIKGNPQAQREALAGHLPPSTPPPPKPKSEYEKALESADKGDLSDALALIHGHTRALRVTSTGVIALLQGEGLIADQATSLDRLSDKGILAVLEWLNARFKEKFGGQP